MWPWCRATRATAILACAKHFVGCSETQGGRDASEADLTPRKLRAWFLPPFERAARAGCRTFMLGYQAIDGTPITGNKWLLKDVLNGEWGFTGTLVTDWDNVARLVWEQKIQLDHVCAAAAADAAAAAAAAAAADAAAVIGAPAHTALNLEEARRSLVLLKNEGLLPLSPGQPLRIAVMTPRILTRPDRRR